LVGEKEKLFGEEVLNKVLNNVAKLLTVETG
jgi:hypothetical protein